MLFSFSSFFFFLGVRPLSFAQFRPEMTCHYSSQWRGGARRSKASMGTPLVFFLIVALTCVAFATLLLEDVWQPAPGSPAAPAPSPLHARHSSPSPCSLSPDAVHLKLGACVFVVYLVLFVVASRLLREMASPAMPKMKVTSISV